MQAIQFSAFGSPPDVAEIVELPEPGEPGAGEVVIRVDACPINPADLLLMSGDYGVRPRLPTVPGGEGVGTVLTAGADVANVKPGDRVLLPMGRGTWRERLKGPAAGLFPLPAEADMLQLAMGRVNPPTAYLMLHDYVALRPGDWVIQNAANSGVGRAAAALARREGWNCVNVVRRPEAVADLQAAGAGLVLQEGPDLAERMLAETGGVRPRLALDAVAGDSTRHLAECLADEGIVVNYGLLSGRPCRISASDLVFRDLSLRGFWLAKWFRGADPADIAALYRQLAQLMVDGTLHVPVEARYPLSGIREALRHAAQGGRSGKILLTPGAAG